MAVAPDRLGDLFPQLYWWRVGLCPRVPLLRARPPGGGRPGGYHPNGAFQCLFLPRSGLAAARARGLFDLAAAGLCAAARAALSLSGVLDRRLSLHGV